MKVFGPEYWDRHLDEISAYWTQKRSEDTQKRFNTVKSFIGQIEYDSLLDVGCGNGNLLRFCSIPTKKYMDIDFSGSMIDEARKNYPKYNFLKKGLSDFSSCPHDIVIAHGFLRHQPNFFEALSNLEKLARKLLVFEFLTLEGKFPSVKGITPSCLSYSIKTEEGYWMRYLGKDEVSYLEERLGNTFKVIKKIEHPFFGTVEHYRGCYENRYVGR